MKMLKKYCLGTNVIWMIRERYQKKKEKLLVVTLTKQSKIICLVLPTKHLFIFFLNSSLN